MIEPEAGTRSRQGRTEPHSSEHSTTDAGPGTALSTVIGTIHLTAEDHPSWRNDTRAPEDEHSHQLGRSSATGGTGYSATVSSKAEPGGASSWITGRPFWQIPDGGTSIK